MPSKIKTHERATLRTQGEIGRDSTALVYNTEPFDARARAWTGRGVVRVRVYVDAAGVVRVWDDVSKYYTTCHALSKRAQARLRRLARI